MYADLIKSAVTVPAVLSAWGYRSDRRRIPCPIHNGTGLNFSIRSDRWHCFVCGEGGDVISLVMALDRCDFKTACATLNAAFRLGIDLSAPVDTDALRRRRAEQDARKRPQEAFDAEYRARTDEFRRLWRAKQEKAPVVKLDGLTESERIEAMAAVEFDREYIEALHRLPYLDWWLQENLGRKVD